MIHRIGPASAPMGFISDIHGNLDALNVVLSELAQQGVVDLYAAGDLLLGGEEPLGVFRRLKQAKVHCVKGPTEVALTTVDPRDLQPANDEESARLNDFLNTRSALGELVLRELAQLPPSLRVPLIDGRELVVVHGSPADMHESISHDLTEDEVLDLLGDDPADIVVCGGTHVPFLRVVEEVEVCNVGSVGAAPEGNYAHYSVISPRTDGASIVQHIVSY